MKLPPFKPQKKKVLKSPELLFVSIFNPCLAMYFILKKTSSLIKLLIVEIQGQTKLYLQALHLGKIQKNKLK